jgi:hypothetical protein
LRTSVVSIIFAAHIVTACPASAMPFARANAAQADNSLAEPVHWRHWRHHWHGYFRWRRFAPSEETPISSDQDSQPSEYGIRSHEWVDPPSVNRHD